MLTDEFIRKLQAEEGKVAMVPGRGVRGADDRFTARGYPTCLLGVTFPYSSVCKSDRAVRLELLEVGADSVGHLGQSLGAWLRSASTAS
jgi:hypothetical protein